MADKSFSLYLAQHMSRVGFGVCVCVCVYVGGLICDGVLISCARLILCVILMMQTVVVCIVALRFYGIRSFCATRFRHAILIQCDRLVSYDIRI